MMKNKRPKENKRLPRQLETRHTLRRKRLERLLAELEAAGPDPHGEINWGKDIGKERF